MNDNTIIWKEDKMLSIRYGAFNDEMPVKYEVFNYDVIYYHKTLEEGNYCVFVRREDGRYGVFETSRECVIKKITFGYDDIYYLHFDLYEGVEKLYREVRDYFPNCDLTLDPLFQPLCLVKVGVEGLLTSTPLIFDEYASSGSGWSIGNSFVCERFSDEFIFINNCSIQHKPHLGYFGKAWYKEERLEIHYDDGGYNNWAAFMFEKEGLGGNWLIVDENKPSYSVNGIYGTSIIMVNFWSNKCDVIVAKDVNEYIVYFIHKEPLTDSQVIRCLDWKSYYTEDEQLFFLVTKKGMQIYSNKQGYLSEKTYFVKLPMRERFKNESLLLEYYTKDYKIGQDNLIIDEKGCATIRELL